MKINLQIHKRGEFAGYINCDINSLNEAASDYEVDEIMADEILDYIPYSQINDIVTQLITKLKTGGTLMLSSFDIFELGRRIVNKDDNDATYNSILFGSEPVKRSCLSLRYLENILTSKGMKTIRKHIQDSRYTLISEKQ